MDRYTCSGSYERIDHWLSLQDLGDKEDEFRQFLYNFYSSNPEFNRETVIQMKYEFNKPEGPLFSEIDGWAKDSLLEGILTAYDRPILDIMALDKQRDN